MFNTSNKTLELHECRILQVYPSGMVDAISNRDVTFEQINVLYGGSETSFKVNEFCVVVSDGAQHYVFGKIRPPILGPSGNTTIRNVNNDLSDTALSNSMVSDDDFGTQAKVVVGASSGVIMDSGENSIIHLDPGGNKISQFSDQREVVSIPKVEQNKVSNTEVTNHYHFRTELDLESLDRSLEKKPDRSKDKGLNLYLDIDKEKPLNFNVYDNGSVLLSITLDNEGKFHIKRNNGSGIEVDKDGNITINASGDITLVSNDNASLELDSNGKIGLGSTFGDVLGILSETLNTLSISTTTTVLGPQPLLTSPQFLELQGKIDLIKKN